MFLNLKTVNKLAIFWMLLWEFLMVDWKFWAPMRIILLKTKFWLVIYVNYIEAAVKTLKTLEAAVGGVLLKKNVFKNFFKLTGKDLCWSLFLRKVPGLRSATLLKKKHLHRCFTLNFAKLSRRSCFFRTLLDGCFWNIFVTCFEKQCFMLKFAKKKKRKRKLELAILVVNCFYIVS